MSANGNGSRPAVFLDRDGTLIEDKHFLSDPERVVLIPGVAEAIRAINERGWLAIVVTNQSGIARGLVTPAQFQAVTARLDALLADRGARLDATYHCPHLPTITGACDCRKPGTAMYEWAARDHGADLPASLYVGDRWRDVLPATRLGGRGILIPSPVTAPDDRARAEHEATVAPTLAAAVEEFAAR